MSHKDLLIEIGTEELPPKALKSLSSAFLSGIIDGLNGNSLAFGSTQLYATPRRLAVIVNQLAESQPDKNIEKFGPAVTAAFNDSGDPTAAALGFAKSCSVDVSDLERADRDGVAKLVFRSSAKGQPTELLLEKLVSKVLSRLPIPKRMRWGSSKVEFVRPVHWITLLYGTDTVQATLLGKEAGRITYGHRFHHPEPISLDSPMEYEEKLKTVGYVIADFENRKEIVRSLVTEQGDALSATVVIDEDLLDEVTSLVEWPVALTGSFDPDFLEVPAEAIISSLKSHQKCFYLVDKKGSLLPNFIAISNLKSKDPAQVIEGNERVIRPRLADADFFYQTDSKLSLESRLDKLKQIVFQKELGTVYEKTQRVAKLAHEIGSLVGADPEKCKRAATLSKCDLVTSMVGEFADLQGIMGKYYALNDGEGEEIANALNEQYMPRHAGDELPASDTGRVLAIADKLDTIVGLFAIGQPPTGSKDPFALRRAAIGILRILVENQIDLDVHSCITKAIGNFEVMSIDPDVANQVFDFLLDRFRYWYQDKGVSYEVFQSVMVLKPNNPVDFDLRVNAVNHFSGLPEASALSSANKRVANILAKLDQDIRNLDLNTDLLVDAAEKQLATAILNKELDVAPLLKKRQYREGLEALASMKGDIDTFFDEVLVMADDPALRDNRIALLSRLRDLFLHVADISYLHKA